VEKHVLMIEILYICFSIVCDLLYYMLFFICY